MQTCVSYVLAESCGICYITTCVTVNTVSVCFAIRRRSRRNAQEEADKRSDLWVAHGYWQGHNRQR